MNDEPVVIAETPRVIIRYFCAGDFIELAPILANREVMKYSLSGVLTSDSHSKFYK